MLARHIVDAAGPLSSAGEGPAIELWLDATEELVHLERRGVQAEVHQGEELVMRQRLRASQEHGLHVVVEPDGADSKRTVGERLWLDEHGADVLDAEHRGRKSSSPCGMRARSPPWPTM